MPTLVKPLTAADVRTAAKYIFHAKASGVSLGMPGSNSRAGPPIATANGRNQNATGVNPNEETMPIANARTSSRPYTITGMANEGIAIVVNSKLQNAAVSGSAKSIIDTTAAAAT